MPTEDRSSNTEQMVSVPRDEVERLVKLLQYQAHPYPSPHAEFWQGLLDAPAAQRLGEPIGRVVDLFGDKHVVWKDGTALDLLPEGAQLYTHPPAQSQGEPVGWTYENGQEFTACPDHAHDLQAEGIELTAVYAHAPNRGKPVALPAAIEYVQSALSDQYAKGWNDSLEAVTKLGPLYTHADAGEVADLRAMAEKLGRENAELRSLATAAEGERDTLRTQLACQKQCYDGLHRDMETIAARQTPRSLPVAEFAAAAIAEALSASAEPGATVERDQGIPGTSFQRLNMLANQGE